RHTIFSRDWSSDVCSSDLRRRRRAAPLTHMDAALRLPYAFAKRHGVVIAAVHDDAVEVMHRPEISAEALLELRRFVARPLRLTEIGRESCRNSVCYSVVSE